MSFPGVLAIVPAFNEAPRLGPVVCALRKLGLPVLVIDDGSTDGTVAVARDAGAEVLRQVNAGKGAALLAGCARAAAQGYARVLLLDGDGQHDPREAPRLLAAADRLAMDRGVPHDQGLVIGRRLINVKRQPLLRWTVNRLSSLLVSMAAGYRIFDSQSGYRVCDPRLLLALPLHGRRYDLESEMCILAARAGVRIAEIPISVIYNGKRSGVHPLFDSVRFLRAVAVSLCNSRPRLRRWRAPVVEAPAAPKPSRAHAVPIFAMAKRRRPAAGANGSARAKSSAA
jgi:glycosyltransferase involved in cell wall biosynthesis